jgi:hypothetical protein
MIGGGDNKVDALFEIVSTNKGSFEVIGCSYQLGYRTEILDSHQGAGDVSR